MSHSTVEVHGIPPEPQRFSDLSPRCRFLPVEPGDDTSAAAGPPGGAAASEKVPPEACESRRGRVPLLQPLLHLIRPLRCENDSHAPREHDRPLLRGDVIKWKVPGEALPPPPPLSDMTAGAAPGQDQALWENPSAAAGPQINNKKQDKESETRPLIPHWERWEEHWEAPLTACRVVFFFSSSSASADGLPRPVRQSTDKGGYLFPSQLLPPPPPPRRHKSPWKSFGV